MKTVRIYGMCPAYVEVEIDDKLDDVKAVEKFEENPREFVIKTNETGDAAVCDPQDFMIVNI